MQLHLNKKLRIWEHIHHKDGDKSNDSIENLEVIDTKDFDYHSSLHHAGLKKKFPKNYKPHNKLSQETINKIYLLIKKNKNNSEIARELGISDMAVRTYRI